MGIWSPVSNHDGVAFCKPIVPPRACREVEKNIHGATGAIVRQPGCPVGTEPGQK